MPLLAFIYSEWLAYIRIMALKKINIFTSRFDTVHTCDKLTEPTITSTAQFNAQLCLNTNYVTCPWKFATEG